MIPVVELDEAVELLRNGASIKQSEYAGGTPITRIETISDWEINPERCGYADISEDDFPNNVLQDGDILISHINSTKHLGKCAMYKGVPETLIHGMNLLVLRVNADIADSDYIYRVLSSQEFRRQLPKITKNSVNQSSFTVPNFKALKIPLPSLKEQKRIAAILDKADAIRCKRQQAIDLTDQLLRSVFLDMFGDPVTNPKGFDIKELKDIARIQIGPFGTQLHKEDYIEGGIPLINPTHIVNGKVVPKSSLSVSSDKHNSLSEYHLSQGDIIMGRRGEMGRCALIAERESGWMCGTGSLFIRPNITGVFSEYLYTLLSSDAIKGYLEGESLGSTMPNLNKGIVGNIKIPVPTDETINKYSLIRKKYDALKDRLKLFSNKALFESLSQQAFNGKLSKQTQAA